MRLSHDRWYSRDAHRLRLGRAQHESSPMRKLLGLGLLLGLVIVCMRQLSDPKRYQPAFEAIGLSPSARQPSDLSLATARESIPTPDTPSMRGSQGGESSAGAEAVLPPGLSSDPGLESGRPWLAMWVHLLKTTPVAVLNELANREFFPEDKGSEASPESVAVPPASVLAWLDAATPRIEQWQGVYREWATSPQEQGEHAASESRDGLAFVQQWLAWASLLRQGVSPASAALDPEMLAAYRLALDRSLLGVIRDAEPWRPSERVALFRTLQRAVACQRWLRDHQPTEPSAPRLRWGQLVDTTSLIKQTEELRWEVVRFRGAPVTTPEPSKSDSVVSEALGYQVIWLRPEGFHAQPVCIYHLSSAPPTGNWPRVQSDGGTTGPTAERGGSQLVAAEDAPLVEVTGLLIKRLAYPSRRGVDVAPLLITFEAQWLSELESRPVRLLSPVAPAQPSLRWQEPGEIQESLRLLREILESNLEELNDAATRRGWLEERSVAANLDAFTELGQILYQLARLERPLHAVLAAKPRLGPARLESFRGWVRRIDLLRLEKVPDAEGRPTTIYRIHLSRHPRDPLSAVAFVPSVPSAWLRAEAICQPVALDGLRLLTDEEVTPRIWLAPRVRWTWSPAGEPAVAPPTAAASQEPPVVLGGEVSVLAELAEGDTRGSWQQMLEPSLEQDWVDLAAVGYDLGELDRITALRKKPFTAVEAGAFYRLLVAAPRVEAASVEDPQRPRPASLTAMDCLSEDPQHTLRTMQARVQLVRATRILVAEEWAQEQLEGKDYYEVDGLVRLDGQVIRLRSDDGATNLDFQGEFPITLVSKQLPDWLRPESPNAAMVTAARPDVTSPAAANQPMVWYLNSTVEVEGFFYRLWSYSTAQTRSLADKAEPTAGTSGLRQLGPLVAVTDWRPLVEAKVASTRSFVREAAMAGLLAAVIFYGLWRLQSLGKKSRKSKS
jgi:hypothetical protein